VVEEEVAKVVSTRRLVDQEAVRAMDQVQQPVTLRQPLPARATQVAAAIIRRLTRAVVEEVLVVLVARPQVLQGVMEA
jgi:hypothetical protein